MFNSPVSAIWVGVSTRSPERREAGKSKIKNSKSIFFTPLPCPEDEVIFFNHSPALFEGMCKKL